jgi:hypothetical protein
MRLSELVLRGTLVVALWSGVVANATPPPGVVVDPQVGAWFESLRQPGTRSPCCSVSDCHTTAYKEHDGHFEIIIDDWPYIVPDAAVIQTARNPTGQGVVCYGYESFGVPAPSGETRTAPQDKIGILCFVPVKATS